MDNAKNKDPKNGKPGDSKPKSNYAVSLVVALLLVILIFWVYNTITNSQYKETKYSEFLSSFENGELHEVQIKFDRIIYMTKEEHAKPAEEQ